MERQRLALISGLCGLAAGMALMGAVFEVEPVGAQEKTEVRQICDYRYIEASMRPNIGPNGVIRYNEKWKLVVEGGWKLKMATEDIYVFEKCR